MTYIYIYIYIYIYTHIYIYIYMHPFEARGARVWTVSPD